MDQGKPDKNLWTLLLLYGDDHCISDHQHSPLSRFGMFSTVRYTSNRSEHRRPQWVRPPNITIANPVQNDTQSVGPAHRSASIYLTYFSSLLSKMANLPSTLA